MSENNMIAIGYSFMRNYYHNTKLSNADRDVTNLKNLQNIRLNNFNLSLNKQYEPRGYYSQGNLLRYFKNENYNHAMTLFTAASETTVTKQAKSIYHKKANESFYVYVTDSDDYSVTQNDSYSCPNCGAVSTIEELLKECPYCQNQFKISELFPKVSCFYGLYNPAGTESDIKKDILAYVKPTGLAGFIISIVLSLPLIISEHRYFSAALVIFLSTVFAAISGYVVWAFRTIGKLFVEAGKSIPLLKAQFANKKIVEKLKKFYPDFDYEYFMFKIVSYCKMLIFSDDDTVLPFYSGKSNSLYDDVIESSFRGGIKIKNCTVKNHILYLDIILYFNNLHYNNKTVKAKDDAIFLALQKDLSQKENYNFSINTFQCKNCNGSYNGYLNKKCPYCDQPVDVSAYDWIITDFK